MKNQIENFLDVTAQTIFDKKGFNILALDVRGISTMTDYFIIAEGNIDRHVRSLALNIRDTLKDSGLSPFHMEGERDGDWVVVDYGHFVVHLFVPDMRHKYALEELWREGKIVDLNIVVEKPSIK
jgi:ribosome-associated protein